MGIFDFVKNAGAKIGIGTSTEEDAAAEAAQAEQEANEVAAKRNANRERMRASAAKRREAAAAEKRAEARQSVALEKYARELGLDIPGLDIRFDDGTAYIDGKAPDNASKERLILAIGNAQGVGRVDEDIEVAEDDGNDASLYVVKSGDTLSGISKEVYGDAMRYPEIFEANKPMLKDPDLIFPGQVLRIPQ
jgi:nucleoid-associated protein YgaU